MQARRRPRPRPHSSPRPKKTGGGLSFFLLVGVFVAGAVAGGATTSLWRAGEGLATLAEQLGTPDPEPLTGAEPTLSMEDFDFFEVLEELPPESPEPEPEAPTAAEPAAPATAKVAATPPAKVQTEPQAQTSSGPTIETIVIKPKPKPKPKLAPAPRAARPAVSPTGIYLLRTGTFGDADTAREQYRLLQREGYEPTARRTKVNNQPVWQIHLGPYASYADMDDVDTHLKSLDIRSLRLKQSRSQ